MLSGKTYDVLKWIAQIWLPALGALYFALALIWGLPAADKVNGSVLAVDAFLGAILGISSAIYNRSDAKYAGALIENPQDAEAMFNLKMDKHPEELRGEKEVTFKVIPLGQ